MVMLTSPEHMPVVFQATGFRMGEGFARVRQLADGELDPRIVGDCCPPDRPILLVISGLIFVIICA